MLLTHNTVEITVIRVGIKGDTPRSRSHVLHVLGSPFAEQAPGHKGVPGDEYARSSQGYGHLLPGDSLAPPNGEQRPDHRRNAASVGPALLNYGAQIRGHYVHAGYIRPCLLCLR